MFHAELRCNFHFRACILFLVFTVSGEKMVIWIWSSSSYVRGCCYEASQREREDARLPSVVVNIIPVPVIAPVVCTGIADAEPYIVPDLSTIYTTAELRQLQEKAERFVERNSAKERSTLLSRCKPDSYFDVIINESGGIEEPYRKDHNGHQKSPINGRVKGLFFSPGRRNGSPFGNICYTTSVESLFNDTDFELFFADFYCPRNRRNPTHRITLVIARIGSVLQRFCQVHTVKE